MPANHHARKLYMFTYNYKLAAPKSPSSNVKRCVTSQRAHNLVTTQIARVQCPGRSPPTRGHSPHSPASPPSSNARCSRSLSSLHHSHPRKHCTTNHHLLSHIPNQPLNPRDIPSHLTPRMKHQPSPPALLDGTGLLQMPLQRAEPPAAKQDHCIKQEHRRVTRSRQHNNTSHARRQGTTSHTHIPAWKQRRPAH